MKQLKLENCVLTFATVLLYSPLFTMAFIYKYGETSPGVDRNSSIIRIGYYENVVGAPRAPVIGMAIDKATSEGLLPSCMYEITSFATDASPKNGTFNALDMLTNHHDDVLFGPSTSVVCEAAGFIASYYKRPIFPEFCGGINLDDKVTYNTLVRIAASWSSLAEAFKTIMHYYGWQRVVVMSDPAVGSRCTHGSLAVVQALSNSSVLTIPITMKTDALTPDDFTGYLSAVQTSGRSE